MVILAMMVAVTAGKVFSQNAFVQPNPISISGSRTWTNSSGVLVPFPSASLPVTIQGLMASQITNLNSKGIGFAATDTNGALSLGTFGSGLTFSNGVLTSQGGGGPVFGVAVNTNAVAVTNSGGGNLLVTISGVTDTNAVNGLLNNATNNDLKIGLNATNDDILFGQNGTNQSWFIGANATNNDILSGQNLTNGAINNLSNYVFTLSQNSTNNGKNYILNLNGSGTNLTVYGAVSLTNVIYGDYWFFDPTNHAFGFIQTNGNLLTYTNGVSYGKGTNTLWASNVVVTGWEVVSNSLTIGTNSGPGQTVIDAQGNITHYTTNAPLFIAYDASTNALLSSFGSNDSVQVNGTLVLAPPATTSPIYQYLALDANSNVVSVTNPQALASSVLSIVGSTSAPSPSTNYTFHSYDITSTNFTTLGGKVNPTTLGAFGAYFGQLNIQTGGNGQTNFEFANAMSVSFGVDGPMVVVRISGNGATWSVVVNGVDNFITTTVPNDSAEHWYQINFPSYGKHIVTLNNAWPFLGVYTYVTNGFFTVSPLRTRKMALMGDSFVEQSYQSTANSEGIASQLQWMWPNVDVWALGEGGTGWLNPGISGGTNFLGRIGDFAAIPDLQYAIVFGGINDTAYCTNTSVTNICFNAITNFIVQFTNKYPSVQLSIIGPQWPRLAIAPGDQNVFNEGILLSNACATYGIPFANPLTEPWITGNTLNPNSGNADNYTRSADTTHPTVPFGAAFYAGKIANAVSTNFSIQPGIGITGVGIYGTANQITISNTSPMLGSITTLALSNPLVTPGNVTIQGSSSNSGSVIATNGFASYYNNKSSLLSSNVGTGTWSFTNTDTVIWQCIIGAAGACAVQGVSYNDTQIFVGNSTNILSTLLLQPNEWLRITNTTAPVFHFKRL